MGLYSLTYAVLRVKEYQYKRKTAWWPFQVYNDNPYANKTVFLGYRVPGQYGMSLKKFL